MAGRQVGMNSDSKPLVEPPSPPSPMGRGSLADLVYQHFCLAGNLLAAPSQHRRRERRKPAGGDDSLESNRSTRE
jgi:hypothetical protein